MTLQSITDAANAFCDESFNVNTTVYFANEAIAVLNTRLKSTLPVFNTTNDYSALDDNWLRLLIVPYVSYSIKRNDGSIAEADRFYGNFSAAFAEIQSNKYSAIAEDYRTEDFGDGYQIDTTNAVNVGWFKNTGSDDFPW